MSFQRDIMPDRVFSQGMTQKIREMKRLEKERLNKAKITNKQKVKQMKRGYSVLKLSELANQIGLPSSKGYKTKDYLELVINEIEDRDLRFVQFLQLVDVLYVVVESGAHKQSTVRHVNVPAEKFRPDEEIANHYHHPDPVIDSQLQESIAKTPVMEVPRELEEVKKRDHLKKNLKKDDLPWK